MFPDAEQDLEIDGLEKLISTFRELDDSDIVSSVLQTLQINPSDVNELRVPTSSTATQYNFGLSKTVPGITRSNLGRISTLKRRLSLIHHQVDPYLSPKSDMQNAFSGRKADVYDKLMSNRKDLNDVMEESQSSKRVHLNSGIDLIDEKISQLGQRSSKAKLLDVDMIKRPLDHSSDLHYPFLSTDVHNHLAEISNLKRHILLEKSSAGLQQVSSNNAFGDSSVIKGQKKHFLSSVSHIVGCTNIQNSFAPFLLSGKKMVFEDKIRSVITKAMEGDMSIGSQKIPEDHKRCQCFFLEDTAEGPDGRLNGKELQSSGSDIKLEENGQHSEAFEDLKNRRTRRKAPSRRRNTQNSMRNILADAGTIWKSGVRRSTRIRMKPLQHWCGERFLFGRVHDSMATVIGVKKYESPGKDGRGAVMKVKSFVSGKYADLVAQAALH